MDAFTVVADAAAWNGVTSEMISGVFDEIKGLLPMFAPAVVGFIGFRKAWGFIKSTLKGA